MNKPRFTFCIPNLNKVEFLPACIEGVLTQDCDNWCCVFVDGYSTDGSWEYMQQFASDPRFKLLRGLKQGMYEDWNECLRHVNTEYFYFLTSDDTCSSQLVSQAIAALDAYPSVHACHFKYDLIDKHGEVIESYQEVLQRNFRLYIPVSDYTHLRAGIGEFFLHYVYGTIYRTITSLVFRRCLLPQMKGFSREYGTAGDYDWTMRLGLFTDVLYLPETLATWRIYDGQATQNLESSSHRRRILDIAKNNFQLFQKMERKYQLKKIFYHQQELLADFYSEYGWALREEIIGSNSPKSLIQNTYHLLANCPFYAMKKVISRLSQGRFYQYHADKERFALRLISGYGIPWPPKRLDGDNYISIAPIGQ